MYTVGAGLQVQRLSALSSWKDIGMQADMLEKQLRALHLDQQEAGLPRL